MFSGPEGERNTVLQLDLNSSRCLRSLQDHGPDRPRSRVEVVDLFWLSRRQLRLSPAIFDRTKDHLVAFVQIAFVSILSRRLKRLLTEEVSA